jgi:hypothetical protein
MKPAAVGVRRTHMRARFIEIGTLAFGVVAAILCAACAPHPVPSQHHAVGSTTPGGVTGSPPAASPDVVESTTAPGGADAAGTAAMGPPPPPLGQVATAVVGTTRVPCATQRWIPADNGPVIVTGGVRAVVRCVMVQRRYPGLGTWDVELAEVADSGIGPFVFGLAHPPPPPSVAAACPANIELEPWFALVSNGGEQTQPGTAPGICGWPDGRNLTLFHDLDFRVVDAVRTEQIASDAASTTSGCPLQWQDVAAAVGDGLAIDQVFAVADGSDGDGLGKGSSALVCAYRAGPPVDGVRNGSLLAGALLPDVTLATSVAGFDIPNSFYECPRGASTFATLTFQAGNDPGGVGYVELDGCNRAVATNGGFGIATESLVQQINTLLQHVPPTTPST